MTAAETKALKDHLASLDLPPDDSMAGVVVAALEAFDRHLEAEALSEARRKVGEAALKRLEVLEARLARVREYAVWLRVENVDARVADALTHMLDAVPASEERP